jgi:hypothetical protein
MGARRARGTPAVASVDVFASSGAFASFEQLPTE